MTLQSCYIKARHASSEACAVKEGVVAVAGHAHILQGSEGGAAGCGSQLHSRGAHRGLVWPAGALRR